MKYIQYSIALRETGNASGKAKRDAYNIALNLGFMPSYQPSNKHFYRIAQQVLSLPHFIGADVILCQYPAISEPLLLLFDKVTSSKSYKIALIHDLKSLQGLNSMNVQDEIKLLNIFDCLIVHNTKMDEYIRGKGYCGKTIILEVFDYLHDVNRPVSNHSFSNSIAFAGNLQKASFINKLNDVNCSWLLYGKPVDGNYLQYPNVSYKGLLPSDEIPYLMEGDYGLVWDGDSIETCSGNNGKYLEYNNPHKLSCIIASGKPVITWKNAAIAKFVELNEIGITVNSLLDLNNIDLNQDYEQMKNNVLKVKERVGKGFYLNKAIMESLII